MAALTDLSVPAGILVPFSYLLFFHHVFSQCEGYEEERMKLKEASISKWSVLVSSTTRKWATTEYETRLTIARVQATVQTIIGCLFRRQV